MVGMIRGGGAAIIIDDTGVFLRRSKARGKRNGTLDDSAVRRLEGPHLRLAQLNIGENRLHRIGDESGLAALQIEHAGASHILIAHAGIGEIAGISVADGELADVVDLCRQDLNAAILRIK